MTDFIERHKEKILGEQHCFDRLIFMGTIPVICHAQGITGYFYGNGIRIFDFAQWAKPLREEIRENAERVASKHGIEIEFIRKIKSFRKEDRIKEIIAERGEHPGLVHIFSAMESCNTYEPWHNKQTHKTYLRSDAGKCLHYYYYFIDAHLGLCYLRVPTWVPFRLQFYCNGHSMLARALDQHGIEFELHDNAFVWIEDIDKAQQLANDIRPSMYHRILDRAASDYCPVIRHFAQGYHWSIMQAEYATDTIFKRREDLKPIYDDLVRTTTHAIKPEHVAMFLGRKLHGLYDGELGSGFSTRIEGTCIKHYMGKNRIKMYDKHGCVLRIETVTNDVSFFKHYRRVEHRDGTSERKVAPMRKSIYSLPELAKIMQAANRRYLEFISAVDDPTGGIRDVDKISRPARDNDRSYRGFNLFHGDDIEVFRIIARGEFFISGFRSKDVRRHLIHKSQWQISYLIKRLRKHGIIKKIGHTYKYYLSALGKRIIATALKIKEMFVIPYLRGLLAPS